MEGEGNGVRCELAELAADEGQGLLDPESTGVQGQSRAGRLDYEGDPMSVDEHVEDASPVPRH